MIPILTSQESACVQKTVDALNQGMIIAYPTEAIYGLGCDPQNAKAIKNLYTLKERDPSKGLILISHNWETLAPWITPLSSIRMDAIFNTWPGPVTWILPASPLLPTHLKNSQGTVAVRITDHPFSRDLCKAFKKPLISTSANKSHNPPCVTPKEVQIAFLEGIALIVDAPLGSQTSPTEIRLGSTGEIIREGEVKS